MAKGSVSHDRSEESALAKARWFKSLPLEERMALLCEFTDLALSVQPDLATKRKHAQPAQGRIQIQFQIQFQIQCQANLP